MIPISPLVFLAIILAVGGTGFGVGYKTKATIIQAEKTAVLEAEREELLRVKAINVNLQTALTFKEQEVKVVYKTVTKKIPFYVTKIQKIDSNCNLSTGNKRLLNELIDSVPGTSSEPTSSDREPSDIRAIDTINYLSNTIRDYKLAQASCNTLIDWHRNVNNHD